MGCAKDVIDPLAGSQARIGSPGHPAKGKGIGQPGAETGHFRLFRRHVPIPHHHHRTRPFPAETPKGLHLPPAHHGRQPQMGHDQPHRPPFPLQIGDQNPAGLADLHGKGEMVVAENRILRQQAVSVSARRQPPAASGGWDQNKMPFSAGGTAIRAGLPIRCGGESGHPLRSSRPHRERRTRSPRRSAPDPTPRHSPARGGCCRTSPAPNLHLRKPTISAKRK